MTRALGPRFKIHYAVKANPDPQVLRFLADADLGADVASGGELTAALEAGFPPEMIEFSGPGKTREELELAASHAIGSINIESEEELNTLASFAADSQVRVSVGLRVNPLIEARPGMRMSGATQFGVPEEDIVPFLEKIKRASGLNFTGTHIHVGSQILDPEVIESVFEKSCQIAASVEALLTSPFSKINFGGGWGINYFEHQPALDVEASGAKIRALLNRQEYQHLLAGCRLIAEPGRFLVGESGVYVCRVLSRKTMRDKSFAVVDGGMHHNYLLAGGMGQVIRRNFFCDNLANESYDPAGKHPSLTIAGSLCTPQDILAQDVTHMPDCRPGDVIVFFNCGAYGATASPTGFLSHKTPHFELIT